MKDFYKVLECDRSASFKDIKKSYRQLSKKYHPDVNPNNKASEEKFKEISEAFQYFEKSEKAGTFPPYIPVDFPPKNTSGTHYDSDFDSWDYDYHYNNPFETYDPVKKYKSANDQTKQKYYADFYEELHAAAEKVRNSEKASKSKNTIEKTIEINLWESITGCNKFVTVNSYNNNSVAVKIAAGTKSNTTIRYPNKIVQQYDGINKDLLLTVKVKAHPKFSVDNNNLHATCNINVWQALVGGKVHFQTIDDHDILITIPAELKVGSSLRIKDQGGYDADKPNHRGDLILKLEIYYPALTEDQKKVIETWV